MDYDPKKLISESFKINGISDEECRSIFFGWVLDFDTRLDINLAIKTLHEKYSLSNPTHPMTSVLLEGLSGSCRAKRRKRDKRTLT